MYVRAGEEHRGVTFPRIRITAKLRQIVEETPINVFRNIRLVINNPESFLRSTRRSIDPLTTLSWASSASIGMGDDGGLNLLP